MMTTIPAIERALRFIAGEQLASGEIPAYRSGWPDLRDAQRDSSVFTTACVLLSLAEVDHPLARAVTLAGLRFLGDETEPPGLWRFWTRGSGAVIDPDLDDTSCASFLLDARSNIDAVLANRTGDGLFATWLRDAASPNDVDPVVNANVALYLGEATPPAVCAYLKRSVASDPESWYYLTPLALWYAVTRAWRRGATPLATAAAICGARAAALTDDAAFTSPLDTALAACTLFSVDDRQRGKRTCSMLLASQSDDGGWPIAAYYRGPEPPASPSVWWGSRAETAALAVEGLLGFS